MRGSYFKAVETDSIKPIFTLIGPIGWLYLTSMQG
jgi:hypothetical protein